MTDAAMLKECTIRLEALGVDEQIIDNFKKGIIPAYDCYGNLMDITDEDRKNIEKISAKGYKVYAIVHSLKDKVTISNYLTVSPNRRDWKIEFFVLLNICCNIDVYIVSERAPNHLRSEYVFITSYHGLHRTDVKESAAWDRAPKFKYCYCVKDIISAADNTQGITRYSKALKALNLAGDEHLYSNTDNITEMLIVRDVYYWNGSKMTKVTFKEGL